MNKPAETQAVSTEVKRRVSNQLSRANTSRAGMWFWEVDRVLLLLAMLLIAIGLVAVAAASPATARRYSGAGHVVPAMYYFWRQLMWVGVSMPVLIGVSMLPVTLARRLSLLGAGFFLFLLLLVPFIGHETNGARRWISLGFSDLQPSEFLKPLFIVSTAWMLSFRAKDPELPVLFITGGVTALVGVLLMMQPDFGQTIVFALVWVILLIVSGISPLAIGGLAGTAVAGVVAAYIFYDTARTRIDNFLFPTKEAALADRYQVEMAHDTLTAGGLTGTGPGSGQMKFRLPEAHTDYIFSVIGEEFGLLACIVIVLLYAAIVVRVLMKQLDEEDAFRLLAASGLAAQFGVQALINMAVNTGIAPSKGMTLPFISYGGSSMIALSIGFGLLLAFTRRNPYLKRSSYRGRWSNT
ncbi:FtsW/RodA/SpoVE family cell cycle protein [Sphingomonas xinjiangensis]|uniref:Probable peptidoglycan glycosyltransferase FtsW n=1 Tax=Sphingomonas xinjiangensis TaxID=643568 RepID=A0A840YED1_9SPHN|nr:putative peptidoglycan glycosyltransferase FtsW [Sphingomonas xinjiangensis]MBB5710645.1 cell division protein FtsW [Sphingomonas xinjiangensis]